jgi:cation-transporting ATPase E
VDRSSVDGEVLAAEGLEIDESLLTGESDPVQKAPG